MQCRAAVSPPSSKMLVKQMQLCASAERKTRHYWNEKNILFIISIGDIQMNKKINCRSNIFLDHIYLLTSEL
jgi:hypothetical protein